MWGFTDSNLVKLWPTTQWLKVLSTFNVTVLMSCPFVQAIPPFESIGAVFPCHVGLLAVASLKVTIIGKSIYGPSLGLTAFSTAHLHASR